MWKRFGGSHGLQVKQCNLHDVLAEKTPKGNLTKMVVVHKRNVKLNNKPTKKRWFSLCAFVFSGIQVFSSDSWDCHRYFQGLIQWTFGVRKNPLPSVVGGE